MFLRLLPCIKRLADNGLALAARIDIRRVDEVDAVIESPIDNVVAVSGLRFHPEHHRAQADV
jgi:hypothetical protein